MGALALGVAVMAPGVADACAVCQPGSEENRFAFIATTAFLTALPLVVVGSIVWWLRLRSIEMRDGAIEMRDDDTAGSGVPGKAPR